MVSRSINTVRTKTRKDEYHAHPSSASVACNALNVVGRPLCGPPCGTVTHGWGERVFDLTTIVSTGCRCGIDTIVVFNESNFNRTNNKPVSLNKQYVD